MQSRSRYASRGNAQSAMYKAASAAHEAGAERADQEDDVAEDSEATWARREAARMRQIMIGKARPEYRRYIQEVPLEQRDLAQPSTPNPKDRVSKRQFDRALGDWRRRLHEFDTEMSCSTAEGGDSSGSVSPSILQSASSPPNGFDAQSTSSSRRRHQGGSPGDGVAIGSQAAATLEQVPSPLAPAPSPASAAAQVPPLPCGQPQVQGNAVDALGVESFFSVPPMPMQPPMEGVVQLRLADQLPEPAVHSMTMPAHQGYGCAVQEYEPYPDFMAGFAAAASLAAPWPLPCDDATAAMMAVNGMHHPAEMAAFEAGFSTAAGSAELAAMLGQTQPPAFLGQTLPAAGPETPIKPRHTDAGLDDGETPPPHEMQGGRHFQVGALGMVTEEPLDKPTRLTYEEWPAANAAADQCPTAARRPTPPRKVAAFPGSPVCRTPPRSRAAMLMRSPGSAVKTPTAGLLVPETPSPERFYPHHTLSTNFQHVMPPFGVYPW
eukprot:TRINITY_DN125_c0_g2_i1.p1 TRINITY_DN125_c0_g2~~TRINITY_DN125_c0_g2_i1.p1  ORF type:complete len:516 (+),score=95.39 TRINITY_DN125_c0_g2_i1:73-1548(+)